MATSDEGPAPQEQSPANPSSSKKAEQTTGKSSSSKKAEQTTGKSSSTKKAKKTTGKPSSTKKAKKTTGKSSSSKKTTGKQNPGTPADRAPRSARGVAWEALQRIERDGAYANLVLAPLLASSGLEERDRGFATALVYGTTRMRRALDHALAPYLFRDVDASTMALLRLGAYQLLYLQTPPHAAVGETVGLAPRKTRGFVNAILRRVGDNKPQWPSPWVELSYPDWIAERLSDQWGTDDALSALAVMNEPAEVNERDDGYVQDPASRWVVEAVDASTGMTVLDMCAAPGGKATLLAQTGATVIAADRRASRVNLVTANAERTQSPMAGTVVADGASPPFLAGSFDRVLVDAPCSGLGVLRRRADARWTIDSDAPARLGVVQRELLEAAAPLVAPGGVLVYSVCTLTAEETIDVAAMPLEGLELEPVSGDQWRRFGPGVVVLPHDHGTDGMAVFRWRRAAL